MRAARLSREFVKLGAAAMRDRARQNAEYMAKRELDANARIFAGCKKFARMSLRNGCLCHKFARRFSEAAKAYPGIGRHLQIRRSDIIVKVLTGFTGVGIVKATLP